VLGVDKIGLPAADLASDVELQHPSFSYQCVDLAQPSELEGLVQGVLQLFPGGKLCVLINNAAISNPEMQSTEDAEQQEGGTIGGSMGTAQLLQRWNSFIATNLTAPYLLSQALLPHMAKGEASIIHISSTRALQSEPHTEGYAASKAGLLGLTHAQVGGPCQGPSRSTPGP
jgi:NAD(P)-dependent dehydrogenase (short-subunit alcohol dehydrogenase family)